MIIKARIQGYRLFSDVIIEPHEGLNIVVGDNESGKSTLLEAINLCLTGRVNGRPASEELNPFWFHQPSVVRCLASPENLSVAALPKIAIEVFFHDADDLQPLRGVVNSLGEDAPGVCMEIFPAAEYATELSAYLAERPSILPVEYYSIEWRSFADLPLTKRPKELAVSFIDSRTVRSASGIDYYMREILSEHLTPVERAKVSTAYRVSRAEVSQKHLMPVNKRIAEEHGALHDRPVGLAMDQSASSTWEAGVAPHVDDIPLALCGQGQQASVKVALAMNRSGQRSSYVLVEEPENHLSHTSLNRLIGRIEMLAKANAQQLFVTTHSSFVLNRLGLDRLTLLHGGQPAKFSSLSKGTVSYFKRLPGYDTLRLVLARSLVLVEGPSDEILFEKFFVRTYGQRPIDRGIDVVSLGGVALARSFELCHILDRKVAAIRDNDGKPASHWESSLASWLQLGRREMFIGDAALGETLEPQMISANGDAELRKVLSYTGDKTTVEWMSDNKTEAAIRIAESAVQVKFPDYFVRAAAFIVE